MIEKCLVGKAHLLDLPADKEGAIRAAVDSVAKAVGLDADSVYKSVMAREQVMSTGMGHGVAIPHAKLANLDDFKIVICRSKAPIDYNSLDSTPVRIVVLMLSPEAKTKEHVKMIAEITKRLKFAAVRQGIFDATTTAGMEEALKGAR